MTRRPSKTWLAVVAIVLTACTGVPDGIEPVDDFELDRYLGTWYEIARLDHRFERGLSNVSAHYSMRDDGGVAVSNRGYRDAKGEWDEAEGKAYFVDEPNVGRLKVSFFGPFYGGYNVFVLDDDYQYAMVVGPDRDYLWILSRTPIIDDSLRDDLILEAVDAGFDIEELIFVVHDREDPAR